jgi:ORF6N domain
MLRCYVRSSLVSATICAKVLAILKVLAYVLPMAKTAASSAISTVEEIERSIHVIRGQRVMLDADLAALYGVTTKRLNEQVSRNKTRFPQDFSYRLTRQEVAVLRSQNATSKIVHGGRRNLPRVFH